MDSYIDLTTLPDPEFAQTQLMDALYAKAHRALVLAKTDAIAVCFPRMDKRFLGNTMRLVGSKQSLAAMMAQPWLQGMRDHLILGEVLPVPTSAEHRSLRRVQAKSSPERLRRRAMRRHQLSAEAAAQRIPDSAAEVLQLPFLQVKSTSTGQQFRLFLRLGPKVSTPVTGPFNAYGLSQTATVPWF
jgi:CRISPR-associated endonuclease Csy4